MSRFDSARRSALFSDLVGALLGRPVDLLPFEEVRERLRLKHLVDRGIREVPLDAIVGSVDRETEFNREFLPRDESLRERWEDVEDLAAGSVGYRPVELYRVGDAHFVVDGHHRVSVARANDVPAIEARVKEWETPVPVGANESIEEIALKSGLADFLVATGLEPGHPDEFRTTVPNGYERLLEHVSAHRYYRGIDLGREVGWDEAVASWHDTVYRPMIGIIRASGVLGAFPEATETDLYLFTMAHLHELRQRYAGREVSPDEALRELKKGTGTFS